MSPTNEPIVRRSWGLRKINGLTAATGFSYEEFATTKSAFRGIATSLTWFVFGLSMALIPPVRWLMKQILPSSGGGPPRDKLEQGWFEVVNVSEARGVVAKSTLKGKRGDPGYFLTSWMIFESALLLLDPNNLTPLGRQGGILTPSIAFGNRLVEALEATGRFEATSEIVGNEESKKTR
ncbi:hypothetical protein RhiJN_12421 [Ceratobasidium sp. AG-Ba]|nr:hypothetical protein RhiJN_12421 [Ceratobasidium sp. AG-Ba]